MKKLLFPIMCLLAMSSFAQVTVTTITSDFNGSGGLSLDDAGNLYIADFGDFLGMPDPDGLPNNVWQLDPQLNLTVYATDFVGASGNSFDNNGVLYQSDIRDSAIYRIVGGVRELVTADGIIGPVGIVFDSNDNFYVCNCGNNTIRKVDTNGSSTLFASGSIFACPNGITIDEDDNLYVVNFSNTNVVKIAPDGSTETIANTPAGNGHVDYDPISNNLYIASYASNQIFSLNINDPQLRIIAGTGERGNTDGEGSQATFSTPNGIAVTDDGDSLYVNCAVPLSGAMINPQIVRLITGLNSLSVDDRNANYSVAAHPNPAQNEIVFSSEQPLAHERLALQVFNALGNTIIKLNDINTNGQALSYKLDISEWASGIYVYALQGDTGSVVNGRFVKR
ncbi:MAG: T9SS type A sorting domain-containing protein [Bacteroidota bacterium]